MKAFPIFMLMSGLVSSILSSLTLSLEAGVVVFLLFFSASYMSWRKVSPLFNILVSVPLLGIFGLIISNGEVGFLFRDDEFYVNQAYNLMKLDTFELLGRYINNVGGAYDNFKYLVALIFKIIAPRPLSVYIVNAFILVILFSLMIPKFKKIRSILDIPYELIFFTFFVFKDLYAAFALFVLFDLIRSRKYVLLILFCLPLIVFLNPLRPFYFLIPFVAWLGLFFKRNIYIFPILVLVYFISFFLLIETPILSYFHEKGSFYFEAFLAKVERGSGGLSLILSGLIALNPMYTILAVVTFVFTPLFAPDDGLVFFAIVRFMTILTYWHFLFRIKGSIANYPDRVLLLLLLGQLLFAPGMLRHSLIILPFLYARKYVEA
jgi:hypothetical protein